MRAARGRRRPSLRTVGALLVVAGVALLTVAVLPSGRRSNAASVASQAPRLSATFTLPGVLTAHFPTAPRASSLKTAEGSEHIYSSSARDPRGVLTVYSVGGIALDPSSTTGPTNQALLLQDLAGDIQGQLGVTATSSVLTRMDGAVALRFTATLAAGSSLHAQLALERSTVILVLVEPGASDVDFLSFVNGVRLLPPAPA